MKILISGEEWHAALPSTSAWGFESLGHDTKIFDDNVPDWRVLASKVLRRSPFLKLAVQLEDSYRRKVGERFLKTVLGYKPDFVWVIGGFRFPEKVVRKIRDDFGIKIANFVVDDPSLVSRTLLYDLGAYSELFVIDKSWLPALEYFNEGRVHYLPHAGDALSFRPLGLEKEVDIAFGGTLALRLPNAPSGYLRAEILNALAEAGFTIRAYANGIKDTFAEFPALGEIDYYDGYKSRRELNELFNKARIVLSVHSPQLKSGVSPRTFDAALSGSFQLVQYMPELPELYPRGVRWFKNKSEAVELAKFYLAHGKERENLAKEALEITLKRHTFKNRAEEVLKIIFKK